MAHPLFGPEVRQMLLENDEAGMKTFCETLHPATVAEALAGDLDVEAVWRVLRCSTIATQAAIFEDFPLEWQGENVQGAGPGPVGQAMSGKAAEQPGDPLPRPPA